MKLLKFNRRLLLKLLIVVTTTVTAGTLSLFLLVIVGAYGRLPSSKELKAIQHHQASEVYSSDNVLMGRYYIENRTNISLKQVPTGFLEALIATEDRRFYQHKGIDRRSLIRVFVKTILLQRDGSGGGSTLSQQLAKNLYPRKKYLMFGMAALKMKEMVIASRLERVYDKNAILELYLNTVSFGENTYGLETASLLYFAKRPARLALEESAMLAGMLKATSTYNPRINSVASLKRRNVVLSQMVVNNYLAPEAADSLKMMPLQLKYTPISHNQGIAPYFREHLRQWLIRWCRENPRSDGTHYNIHTDGLIIHTTINATIQQYAEEAVGAHMKYLQRLLDNEWRHRKPIGYNSPLLIQGLKNSERYRQLTEEGKSDGEILEELKKPVATQIFTYKGMTNVLLSPADSVLHYLKILQAGLLSMEARTGSIRAWVGGIDYRHFQFDHVTSKRQPGSVFKPVVFAAALESGYTPCDFIDNDSLVYEQYNNYTPVNANRKFGGEYSLKGALAHSVNTVSVKLLMNIGFNKAKDMAGRLGIEASLPEVPSVALGVTETSLLEMVTAYAVFANQGVRVHPRYLSQITTRDGQILYQTTPDKGVRVIDETVAQTMNLMLQEVVNSGTASGLRSRYGFTNALAGKTGTTQHYSDGWYIGYTPELATGVWVGADNPAIRFRSGAFGHGSHTALPIWAGYMKKLYTNPLYQQSITNRFIIPDELMATAQCPDYREKELDSLEKILEQSGENVMQFIRRIFRRRPLE